MKIYKPHPAALLFPLATERDFQAIKTSIAERGQDVPAVLFEGKLLDGRNRQEAIRQLIKEDRLAPSTELKVVPFGGGSVAGFVRAANVDRRHLTESQIAMIATRLLPLLKKEAKDRQREAARATNRKRRQPELKLTLGAPVRRARAAVLAAKAAGSKVSARLIEGAERVRKANPTLARKVFDGELTVGQAEKQIKRKTQLKQIAAYVPPAGVFDVVSIDFSWQYDDTLEGMNREIPYPPMPLKEILDFVDDKLEPVCAPTCVLACWVTNPIMLDLAIWPHVQAEIQKLGFRAVKLETWRKTEASGKPFTGLGNGVRNDTEQRVLFARGDVLWNDLSGDELQRTCFDAPIGEHSEKPAVAYERLERILPYAHRLEMFARKTRPGWTTSGAELAQPAASGESAPARAVPPKLEEAADQTPPAPSFSQQDGSGSFAPNPDDLPPVDPASLEPVRGDDIPF